jgi:hypothetical protein
VLTIEDRKPVMRRVCPDCAADAIPILTQTTVTTVKKEVRSDAVQRCIRMLRTYAAAARASEQASKGTGGELIEQGRVQGLEVAIECLKRESGEA